MVYKFRCVLKVKDKVVTYNPQAREYMIGTIAGDYDYNTNKIDGDISDYVHLRKVDWIGKISRDVLSASSRSSLGGILTLFSVNEEVSTELLELLRLDNNGGNKKPNNGVIIDPVGQSHELIKDKILTLSDEEMEQLAAVILRAMGYRTRVTPRGPDGGVDVLASPDGLGLEEPRIKVEVKHRSATVGAPEIRSFLGGLREGDSALYISTGGFTRDASAEAAHSNFPLTLLGLDDVATLTVEHYENFDDEGKVLMPLVKVYFPTE